MKLRFMQVGTDSRFSRIWEGVKLSISQFGIYITLINLFLLCITAYNTGWIQEYIIDINFLQFVGIIFGIIMLGGLVVFFLDMPSFFSAWTNQFWAHDNPLRTHIEDMDKRLENIEKLLKEHK